MLRFFVVPPLHTDGMSQMTATLLNADTYILSSDVLPRWTELIDGEVIVNYPTIRHQSIVQFVQVELALWIRGGAGRGSSPGQVDVKLDEHTVVAPDVLWAAEGRVPSDGTHLDFAPDLVVEVRSPSTWRFDVTTKFRKYELAGVRELWLVDTASLTVLVYRRSTPGSLVFDVALELAVEESLTSPLLHGFQLNIADLFTR
jgi:Uma2 family endonuclease